ncbi:hypothetical protein B0T22DRAFT_496910 [Podospora appendiculata]|uniref:ATPase AAA-type core domain-containing protein n=1 Tax=Podospora appendiculata TaxID=314037 RepID=A0AAE0XJF8_9PEZI|nr:hypothetical protein B0T22DRAFT_496910 [Podospora appendiculata]
MRTVGGVAFYREPDPSTATISDCHVAGPARSIAYQPIKTIDWRGELCRFLALPSTSSDDEIFEGLDEATKKLEEAERLKNTGQKPPRCLVVNRLFCRVPRAENGGLYLDTPRVVDSGPFRAHLRASGLIRNLEAYIERHKDVCSIFHRDFECCAELHPRSPLNNRTEEFLAPDVSSLTKDSIAVISEELRIALQKVGEVALAGMPHPLSSEGDDAINSYLGEHLRVLREYIEERMEQDWRDVTALMNVGKITAVYIEYIFVPLEILLSTLNGRTKSDLQGFTATDWLNTRYDERGNFSALINVQSWSFDGKQKHVWYTNGTNYEELQNSTAARFMVDFATYKQTHPNLPTAAGEANSYPNVAEIGAEEMDQEEPDLGDEFYMCLPTSIYGFNMQKKEWVNLEVGRMEDVQWNTEAFDLLVIDKETKELVKAVVTNQLNTEENTDLLHGVRISGLGTGKTLTAESVLEIAMKPLYRVTPCHTCGDIRTKAEDVEKYLEAVLLLGKTWGCVVLLDEADVFLEQRTINNMERNGLVSVSLRVLEYYDGDNRVGTFDEAFKSRIQLNLRYKNLDRGQRLQIWDNFIDRLEKLLVTNLGINASEIRAHIHTLAEPELNWREIRNALSAARQLVMYRKKFDEYLTEVHGNFTNEEMQRDKGER